MNTTHFLKSENSLKSSLTTKSTFEKSLLPKIAKSLQVTSSQSLKLDQMLNEQIEMHINKWNFDFEKGKPKEGKFLWSHQKP
jgi:hypothetical protein